MEIKVTKDLNISQFSNVIRVGEIIKGNKLVKSKKYILYDSTLDVKWDKNFNLKNNFLSIVYIFTVDGMIKKIGKTDGNGGISAGLSFYLNAGTDDPGLNRFVINRFMRDAIEQNQKVEVYMFYLDKVQQEIPTLFGPKIKEVRINSMDMEAESLHSYYKETGKYPDWNYQEAGISLPGRLHEEYGNYKSMRGKGLK
jgi:hypothetical protein